jgi:hypothetical protein
LNIIVQTSDPFKSSPLTNNAVQYQDIFPDRERSLIGPWAYRMCKTGLLKSNVVNCSTNTHKPCNDTDVTQKFGGPTALRSKHDECNKFWRSLQKCEENDHNITASEVVMWPHVSRSEGVMWPYVSRSEGVIWPHVSRSEGVLQKQDLLRNAACSLSGNWNCRNELCARLSQKLIIWNKSSQPFPDIRELLYVMTTALYKKSRKQ